MKKVDTSNWVDFIISDIFETNKKGKKNNVPTGANVSNKDLKKGTTPRISVTGVNNGILDYFEDIPNNSNYRTHENFISVSFLGTVFYQKEKSSIDMKVHCLKPIKHELTKNTGKFLVSAIIASLKNVSYSDQISSSLLATLKIKLPVNTNQEPDWDYMEKYIFDLEKKLEKSLFKINKTEVFCKKSINTNGWGDFPLGKIINKNGNTKGNGIFNMFHSVAYHNREVEEIGANNNIDSLNYVTRSKFNNGIKSKVIKKTKYIVNPAGTISFGAENANFFYQEEDYITGRDMYYIDTRDLSKNCCLYIKTILESTFTNNFSFSDIMTPSRIYNKTIKLPVNDNGEPDWDYMEKYISDLNDKVKRNLDILDL